MITATQDGPAWRTRFTDGVYTDWADTVPEHGGAYSGFRPYGLIEAALATCLNITVRMSAEKHAIPLESVTTAVTTDRTDPAKTVLTYMIELTGDLSEAQRARLHAAAKACPVHKTLTHEIVVQEETPSA